MFKNTPQRGTAARVPSWHFQVCVACARNSFSAVDAAICLCSPGYDVQSASSRDGVLYITGAPRYNHTGRVVIYRLSKNNQVVVSQILKGEQVSPLACTVRDFFSATNLGLSCEMKHFFWKKKKTLVH